MYNLLASALNHPDAVKPYGGLFNHRSLDALAAAGTAVDVVSPRPFAPPVGPYSAYWALPRTEHCSSYDVHHPRFWYLLPKRLFYGVSGKSFARRVPRYLERNFEVPDVLQGCHIYLDGYGLLPYAREHDLPLFVVAHGKLLNTLDSLPPGVASMVQETLDGATGVLCVSDHLAEIASRRTDPGKVTTVPIGAEPNWYPTDRRSQLRRQFDLPDDATVVLFVGGFIERKGVDDIAAVLPGLDLPGTTFVFVGHQDELESDLRRALSRSPFDERHVYTRLPTETLREWFAVADLFWLPSRSEGRPTVIYEAMASETAVIASRVDGIPEQVADGETGVLVEPGDREGFVEELRRLVSDPARLREMGRRGRRRLEDEAWTWTDHARRVQELHLAAVES